MLPIDVNGLCRHRDQPLRTVKLEREQANRRGETALRSVIWTGCEDCLRVLRIYCSMPEHRTRCLPMPGEPEAPGQAAFREPARQAPSPESGVPRMKTGSYGQTSRGLHYRTRYTKGRHKVRTQTLAQYQLASCR